MLKGDFRLLLAFLIVIIYPPIQSLSFFHHDTSQIDCSIQKIAIYVRVTDPK